MRLLPQSILDKTRIIVGNEMQTVDIINAKWYYDSNTGEARMLIQRPDYKNF